MNDELLMNNYIMILKSTVEVYVHGTIESSNENVRELLRLGLIETLKHQSLTFDKMTEYEWYVVDNINPKQIEKTVCSLCENN